MMEKRTGLAIIAKAGLRVDLDSIKQVLEILRPIATPDHYVQIPVKQREISLQTPSGSGNQEVAVKSAVRQFNRIHLSVTR